MKNATHYSLLLSILLFAFFYFSILGHATAQNKKEPTKKKLASSLMIKSKKALLSGNTKLAENYWKQANALEPEMTKPLWLKNDSSIDFYYKREQNKVLEEKKFIQLLHEMPYEKAKIELDKKLLSNPNNTKLRLVYIELAEKNNDNQEANRHRSILGIKPNTQSESNLKFWLKTILTVIVITLIIIELTIIYTTTKKNNSQIPTNIKSL